MQGLILILCLSFSSTFSYTISNSGHADSSIHLKPAYEARVDGTSDPQWNTNFVSRRESKGVSEVERGFLAVDIRGPIGVGGSGKALTVGTGAHNNAEDGIGIGVKATLVEGSVSGFDGALGAKVGLSADTGFSIGRNVEVKALGTGFKAGVSGVELCFFGSCLWVG